MNQLNLFIELTRLKKPIGYMLLFWPCIWGLTIAYDFSENIKILLSCTKLIFLEILRRRRGGSQSVAAGPKLRPNPIERRPAHAARTDRRNASVLSYSEVDG